MVRASIASGNGESDDDLLFLKSGLEEDDSGVNEGTEKPWKILIVDDEEEVHMVTRLALDEFTFAGRHLEFVSAYSGEEARSLIADHPDTAIILLDVVMETDEAGLEVAQFVRQDLGNRFVRIILRTGQPGLAPERRVLTAYDINDYRAKTELTQDRLFSVIYTALASYRDLIALARSRHQLIGMVNELEQFAHIAASDLQKPVVKLVAALQQLRDDSARRGENETQQQLNEVWEHTASVEAVVNDLVTLTKAGTYNEARELTRCEDVLEEVAGHLHEQMVQRNVSLTHDALPTVYACRRQLVQLFENLLSNAIKFQPGDAAQIHISATSRGRSWQFAVADKGIGIKPEDQRSIFNVFKRGHSGGDYEGSGIGLAICEKVVRWHGGKIWVESELGEGSTFFFTIPLSE